MHKNNFCTTLYNYFNQKFKSTKVSKREDELQRLNKIFENKLSQLNAIFDMKISKIIPQTEIKLLEVHIAEHCNLNCKNCSHFSPIADEEFLNPEELERDFQRLSQLTKNISCINILGGEPLLNNQLCKILEITRKYFVNTRIQLVTNGLLLNSMNEIFWKTLNENNIILCPTKYPINIDWDLIDKKRNEYNVKLTFYNDTTEGVKTLFKWVLNEKGIFNTTNSFINCAPANYCVQLSHGKLYTCPTAAYIKHFNKYFNKNIPQSDKDGIDIYKAQSIDEILEFLSKPIPLCKYCNVKARTYGHEWGISKKEIEEWT